jgi:hypothetical protein
METWQILCRLAAHMGYRFKMKYTSVAEIQEEIQRAIPLYHQIVVDSPEADGTWGLSAFQLAKPAFDYSKVGTAVTPVGTLALDHLEGRFSRWFDEIFTRARKIEESIGIGS